MRRTGHWTDDRCHGNVEFPEAEEDNNQSSKLGCRLRALHQTSELDQAVNG